MLGIERWILSSSTVDAVQLGLDLGRLLAELAAFFLAGLALGRVLGFADRLRHLVGLLVELVDPGLFRLPLGFERQETIDVDLHAAVDAVLFHAPVRFRR